MRGLDLRLMIDDCRLKNGKAQEDKDPGVKAFS